MKSAPHHGEYHFASHVFLPVLFHPLPPLSLPRAAMVFSLEFRWSQLFIPQSISTPWLRVGIGFYSRNNKSISVFSEVISLTHLP